MASIMAAQMQQISKVTVVDLQDIINKRFLKCAKLHVYTALKLKCMIKQFL